MKFLRISSVALLCVPLYTGSFLLALELDLELELKFFGERYCLKTFGSDWVCLDLGLPVIPVLPLLPVLLVVPVLSVAAFLLFLPVVAFLVVLAFAAFLPFFLGVLSFLIPFKS